MGVQEKTTNVRMLNSAIVICAVIALAMMMIGSIGTGVVPLQFFGIVERFSVFSAVGFNAVLGLYLFKGFSGLEGLQGQV